MGGGRVYGSKGLVGKGIEVREEVKRDVGGDEERFRVWGPNTLSTILTYISPPHILTFPYISS